MPVFHPKEGLISVNLVGKVNKSATTQVVEEAALPPETLEEHDLPVDIICTPSRTVYTQTSIPRPPGVLWDIVTEQMYRDIGALKVLRDTRMQKSSG